MSIYQYRYIGHGASWGLVLDIDCKIVPLAEFSGTAFSVNDLIHLGMNTNWVKDEVIKREEIDLMLSVLTELILELGKHISIPTVIEIIHANILPTDFQTEVFGYALVGWLCREFDLEFQLPAMIYDKRSNKYVLP